MMDTFKNEPLVSIMMTVYNGSRFLNYSIPSVLNQTYKNLQLIIINDGSTDDSIEQISKFKSDNRVILISQNNKGKNASLSVALSISQGEYLTVIDQDDFVDEIFIEKMIKYSLIYNSDVVISNYKYLEKFDSKIVKNYRKIDDHISYLDNNKEIVKEFLGNKKYNIYLWNKLFKREIFKDFLFPEHYVVDDLSSTYKLISKCSNLVYIENINYYHVIIENSLGHQNTNEKYITDFLNIIYEMQEFYLNTYESNEFQIMVLRKYFNQIIGQSMKVIAYNFKSMKELELLMIVKLNFGEVVNRNNLIGLVSKLTINILLYIQNKEIDMGRFLLKIFLFIRKRYLIFIESYK